MSRRITLVLTALAIAWCLPVAAVEDEARADAGADRTAGQTVEDATITARLETIFLLNEHLNPFRINTSTRNGTVTLDGTVDDAVEKDLAESLAKSLDGVTQVDNQLAIEPRKSPKTTTEKNVTRGRIHDANLTAAVRHRLAYNATLRDANIGVEAKDQAIRLYGTVPSSEAKEEALEVARQTQGVLEVRDNLVVEGQRTARADTDEVVGEGAEDPQKREPGRYQRDFKEAVDTVGDAISDEWVEKRIETQLAWNRNVSLLDLDVEVKDGVAVISGDVISDAQKDLAGAIARRTSGVRDVENRIEVREMRTE